MSFYNLDQHHPEKYLHSRRPDNDQKFHDRNIHNFQDRRVNDRNHYTTRQPQPQSQYPKFMQDDSNFSQNQKYTLQGNRKIVDYHLFTPKYEKKDKEPEWEDKKIRMTDSQSIKHFNQNVDQRQSLDRPLATRDQVKEFYRTDPTQKKSRDYINNYQFQKNIHPQDVPFDPSFDFYTSIQKQEPTWENQI